MRTEESWWFDQPWNYPGPELGLFVGPCKHPPYLGPEEESERVGWGRIRMGWSCGPRASGSPKHRAATGVSGRVLLGVHFWWGSRVKGPSNHTNDSLLWMPECKDVRIKGFTVCLSVSHCRFHDNIFPFFIFSLKFHLVLFICFLLVREAAGIQGGCEGTEMSRMRIHDMENPKNK